MDKLELKALGKLNLGLDILGQMENGYHEVRMVMQTVYLYDRVLLEKTEGMRFRFGVIWLIFRIMRITLHIRQQQF